MWLCTTVLLRQAAAVEVTACARPRTRANSAPRLLHSSMVAERVCGSVREANNHTLHSETGLRIAHRATDLLRPGEFSNVVDYDVRNGPCRTVGIGCDASGASNKACLAKDILTRMRELAQGGSGIAVAFRLGSGDRPFVYGHIYALVMGFAQALGFAQAAATPSVVPLYLHHSASLGSFRVVQAFMAKARKTASDSMFAEVVALFTEAVGVKIKLRPWVPHCGPLASPRTITCVMGRNGVPETLRGRVSLLLNVPSANSMARPPARHLRHIVAHSLGLSREPQNVALLVATGRASNGRTIANEDEVQSALRAYFADAAPLHSLKQRLSFVHQDVQSLPLVEEARLFRRARLVVALFGSTFWNCLFMERPAVAVQIHGALKDDVDAGAAYGWCALCALNCGVGWIPLSVEGAMPRWKNCSTIGRVPHFAANMHRRICRDGTARMYWQPHRFTAVVNVTSLLDTVGVALRGDPVEYDTQLEAFKSHLLSNPDPRIDQRVHQRKVAAEDRKCRRVASVGAFGFRGRLSL